MKKFKTNEISICIEPPNNEIAKFTIRGTSPLVMNKFSAKAREEIKNKQEMGRTAESGHFGKGKKKGKNFLECYEEAKHISIQGWCGIPAPAFRNALISACRMVGFVMTRAKLSLFVEADGFDKSDGTPLVKITKGIPHCSELPVRLPNGSCDIHPRPMWNEGWEAVIRIRFDADQFTVKGISNLLTRVGSQIGILEGRYDSKNSCGMGWGCFEVLSR